MTDTADAEPDDTLKPILEWEFVSKEHDHSMVRFFNPDYTGRHIETETVLIAPATEAEPEKTEEREVDKDPFQHFVTRINTPMTPDGKVDEATWAEWLHSHSLSAKNLMDIARAKYLAQTHQASIPTA